MRYGNRPAFVGGFSDGQILVLSAGCDKFITFGTTRFYDCGVAGIDLVDKREGLVEEHAYLPMSKEQELGPDCGELLLEAEYPNSKGLRCSLLHTEDSKFSAVE
jgi:hypothetical protein